MDSLDNMKQLIETVSQLDQPKKTGMLKENYRYPTDYTYSELAKLISDYVIDNELDLDFDNLQSVADELNATLHYDRLDAGDPEVELDAGHIESVLPEVHQYLMGEIEATDPETAPDHAQRLIATAEKINQYPGVTTEDMLVPREYDFDDSEEEIEEADRSQRNFYDVEEWHRIRAAEIYARQTDEDDITDSIYNRFNKIADELEASGLPVDEALKDMLALDEITHAEARAFQIALGLISSDTAIDEADLNNGYGQHHKVDGEDLFPNGDDGPIQKKIPSRSDNRLGRDKTVSVDLVKEHLERFERMYKGYMKK